MRPTFQIIADSVDITSKVADRLLSLSITDEAGLDSDTLTIVLDDRDNQFELPTQGAELAVLIGIDEQIADKGLYTVDELTISSSPDTIEIRAKAADMRTSLKERRTGSWDNETLGSILEAVAGRNGLTPAIAPTLASLPITHLDQTNEHDLHLVTRLAKEYDAVGKVATSHLLFTTKGDSKSASGKQLPSVVVKKDEISNIQVVMADRGKYQSTQAFWHDHSTGEQVAVNVGNDEPVFKLKHTYDDEGSATRAAKAKLSALKRGTSTGSLSMPCTSDNLNVLAESKLILKGFREGIEGEWVVTRTQYELSDSGLTLSIEFETPNK
ncbi:phage late control D family protein [Pseudoalteromonas sp. JBTF-M23]|uniref:Phage late control D family protein n=1 Tax=Pseudoalteromonas caenipelagi TaxID=2726988 RepID=A0A849VIF0_9GAMM|nr:contractile injection system protein, VgrG/Pvc8 family [Pseudoalteromonas caenipelagi]NOU53085.1 phage late control D family protein [Pseudoalteromonas caenipelagi]